MTIAETDVVDADSAAEPSDDAVLIEYLRTRNVACPLCGYNLRGLTACRCPECGRGLQLSVGLIEPRIGAWVTCLVAVTAPAGMGVVAVLSLVQNGWEMMSSGEDLASIVAIWYFLATLLFVPAVIVLRRRYRRLSQPIQWSLAGLAIALMTFAFAALFVGL